MTASHTGMSCLARSDHEMKLSGELPIIATWRAWLQKIAKKIIFVKYIVLIMCLLIDINAHAADMPAIAKDHCGGCHAVENKLYAPSLKEIAMKYRGDADIVNKLTENTNRGGVFGWNAGMRMPARGLNANDKEIKAMVEFIVDLSIADSSSK